MEIVFRVVLLLIALAQGARAAASGDEIVFLAPTNHTIPVARFEAGRLSAGLLKDLGEAIAARLGLRARFVSVPSKRVGMALAQGNADAVCHVEPSWIDGAFSWSVPFIPHAELLVARAEAPVVASLSDLANQRVGTVSGYRYPEIELAIGQRFMRDDAPTTEHNLRKLAAGRVQYAVLEQVSVEYHMRNDPTLKLRTDRVITKLNTRCAYSSRSNVPAARIDAAINALVVEGKIASLLTKYR